MKTSNELHDLWIAEGDKVENMNEKLNAALLDDSVSAEELQEIKNARDTAKTRRDMFKEQYVEARASEVVEMKEKPTLTEEETTLKNTFISNFKNMIKGKPFSNASSPATPHLVSSGEADDTEGNGGLTIPKDIRTAIMELTRQFENLQSLVTVENTSVKEGSRNINSITTITPLVKLNDEDTDITELEGPKLHIVKYLIADYAGILTVTNNLLSDSAENILAWLTNEIAKKVVVTRNTAILASFGKTPRKPNVTKFDDIKDVFYSLDPALRPNGMWITNTSGIRILAKVKNANGDYLLQKDVTRPDTYLMEGKIIKEINDVQLPDTATSTHPLYFGDTKAYATLFDRQNMSLATSTEAGNAFYRNQTKLRVIDRFDVQVVDKDALVAASFKAVADQEGNVKATTAG
ncbi:HK97 family phage major capsid protein [Streptococcus urinalis FB127-CNA-2]|uniref:Phage major capsid protein, HK97 family n=1 Tax=Streptococcus urinalis 2285-97 TaxID=764291 RepID=G5KEJ5_9STRE|nr:phage major capsid protein [Streptococcus urinalis]QBX22153.1 capsid protein [Streptococcus phage Javan637]QBX31609.1 capsid protein [Streptococcus phage Javan642]QBX31646.1 capsid protein [Streptococcus phage Javan648]EHJ57603.1 phage major capsid protein, HK97 family [Streptococcus urinalis 2285-97]EKS21893.1 HK97 family phage major capsid protein [Streptococcus urinalis FB127-CNA-2]